MKKCIRYLCQVTSTNRCVIPIEQNVMDIASEVL